MLAIALARGEAILKLDADTLVQPELLLRQPLGAREFLRGCSHRTTDENALEYDVRRWKVPPTAVLFPLLASDLPYTSHCL